jgi:hypothetical protein
MMRLHLAVKTTGISLKGTDFRMKGTGFSPYIIQHKTRGFSP